MIQFSQANTGLSTPEGLADLQRLIDDMGKVDAKRDDGPQLEPKHDAFLDSIASQIADLLRDGVTYQGRGPRTVITWKQANAVRAMFKAYREAFINNRPFVWPSDTDEEP